MRRIFPAKRASFFPTTLVVIGNVVVVPFLSAFFSAGTRRKSASVERLTSRSLVPVLERMRENPGCSKG